MKVTSRKAAMLLGAGLVASSAGVAGGTALNAAASGPSTQVHCGQVITQSITVANDLTCPVPANPGPPGKGTPPFGLLVPGQKSITIDLGGHTITGPRTPGPSADVQHGRGIEMTGVQLSGSNNVTVRNGTIQNFDAGVSDSGGSHNHLQNLTVQHNHNYETVNGAIDYLPPGPSNVSVTPSGTGSTSYTYAIATAQADAPATTPGDNGTDGHSYTQDSLLAGATPVSNSSTLSSTNSNAITFTGVAPAYATGYRIIRSVNGGPQEWLGTVAVNSSNSYTFVDSGQAPTSTSYHEVSLANFNVSKDDSCDNGDGIIIDASNHDVAVDNTSNDNGPFSGVAMVGEYNGHTYNGAWNNVVTGNSLSQNAVVNVDPGYNNPHNAGMDAYCGTGPGGGGMTRGRMVQDMGVRLEGPNAQYNTVEQNTIEGSGFNGVAIHSYVCNSNGPQPNAEPNSYNTITGNTISDTGKYTPAGDETNFDGIGWLASGPGNVVCVSGHNTVTNNTSFDNLRNGIYMGGRGNAGNTVTGNTVHDNGANGIEADRGSKNYSNPPTYWGVPNNVFSNNTGYANAGKDGQDNNTNCSGDAWSGDSFGTVNQPCVQ